MRIAKTSGVLHAQLISGTHVVLIGLNMTKTDAKGLLGFSIHRTDNTEQESYWLEGQKRFKATDPGFPAGTQVSTQYHPVQSFFWADYTAKPEHSYTYLITAERGSPEALQASEAVSVTIATESEVGDTHDVLFNRGAISSQAFVRRFGNRSPDDIGAPAFQWLSRGLEEALLGFIRQASGKNFSLRAAIYEFQYAPVLEAFRQAKAAGADVQIIYDAKNNSKKDPKKKNEAAIDETRIKSLCMPRTANPSYIAHNKFIVLLEDGRPIALWTGSTNITENGIFGHLNVGHIVRDTGVAQQYLDYWDQLSEDPEAGELRPWIAKDSPVPTQVTPSTVAAFVFSPRKGVEPLDWYSQLLAGTQTAVFLTGAFGIPAPFVDTLEKATNAVRYIVLDKAGNGDDARALVKRLKRVAGNQIVVATLLKMNEFDLWLAEEDNPFSSNVEFLHTKFLLVDPLGDDPWLIAGSANFSTASTTKNDENMLVIRGNARVCDIYLGEFMRTYSHYAFREWAASVPRSQRNDISWLDPTDEWLEIYFKRGARKCLERNYFCPL